MVYRPLRYEQIMQAADAYEVRARRMFGGMGVYTGERMFAFLVDNDVALKLCPDDYAAAMELPGAGEMRPEAGADPLREYVKLPKTVLDNADDFLLWVEKSAEYVRNRAARLA
ncbi:MAG TPA: TfoX/Sxy family protein [Fimbriimonas sp.]|nr:TfoX/Sxy family protein [Fimbriimonas sp.]